MNTQKAATVTMQDEDDQKIYIRKCSKPEAKACEIYDALSYKHQPWIKNLCYPKNKSQKLKPLKTRTVEGQGAQVGLTHILILPALSKNILAKHRANSSR